MRRGDAAASDSVAVSDGVAGRGVLRTTSRCGDTGLNQLVSSEAASVMERFSMSRKSVNTGRTPLRRAEVRDETELSARGERVSGKKRGSTGGTIEMLRGVVGDSFMATGCEGSAGIDVDAATFADRAASGVASCGASTGWRVSCTSPEGTDASRISDSRLPDSASTARDASPCKVSASGSWCFASVGGCAAGAGTPRARPGRGPAWAAPRAGCPANAPRRLARSG